VKGHLWIGRRSGSPISLAMGMLLGACEPDLGPSDSVVTAPRILAVRANPAEARAGDSVTFTPLVAGPGGPVEAPAVAWSYCLAPKPLAEDNVVSTAYLNGQSLLPFGDGPMAKAPIPTNACSLFGPDVPTEGARPRDPDATGGYYQPVRADVADSVPAIDLVRITCDLANAPASAATAFAEAYVPNHNPTLLPLVATVGGTRASISLAAMGTRLALTASWPAESAETHPRYDVASGAVSRQREAMRVAWYARRGSFDVESTGRAANDPATNSANVWTAPRSAGTAYLWVVLRDSRGGVDFASYEVTVGTP
jgi:hypothetical protein